MQYFAERHNANLLVAYLPLRNQVTNYYNQYERDLCLTCPEDMDLTTDRYQIHIKQLTRICKSLEIPFYDLSNLIRIEEENGNHLYWNYDIHMRGKGYLTIGENLFTWWESLPSIKHQE